MKKLYRCRWDRKILGVFGGLGQFIQVDPTLLRLIAVILIPLTAFVILPVAYLICGWVMPEGPKAYIQPHFKRLRKSHKNRILTGVCGGIGTYIRVSPNIIRIATIVLCFFSFGYLIFAYIAAIFIMPEDPRN